MAIKRGTSVISQLAKILMCTLRTSPQPSAPPTTLTALEGLQQIVTLFEHFFHATNIGQCAPPVACQPPQCSEGTCQPLSALILMCCVALNPSMFKFAAVATFMGMVLDCRRMASHGSVGIVSVLASARVRRLVYVNAGGVISSQTLSTLLHGTS